MLFTAPGQAVLVSQERKSRAVLSAKQPGKAALPTAQRLLAWLEAIDPQLRKTITFDNGTEFAQHLMLVDRLGLQTFFCDAALGMTAGAPRRQGANHKTFEPEH